MNGSRLRNWVACATVCAALVAFAKVAEAGEKRVTIPVKSFPVGTVGLVDLHIRMAIDYEVHDKVGKVVPHKLSTEVRQHSRLELLAVNGTEVSREKETYFDAHMDVVIDQKNRGEDLPSAGKTVVRERRDGQLVVTDENGAPLTGKLAVEQKAHETFGLPNPVDAMVRGRPLVVGKGFPITPAAATLMSGGDNDARVIAGPGTATLREVRGKLAIFAVRFSASRPGPPGLRLNTAFEGTMTFELTYGQVIGVDFHGVTTPTLDAPSQAKGLKVTGTGITEIKVTTTVGGAGGRGR